MAKLISVSLPVKNCLFWEIPSKTTDLFSSLRFLISDPRFKEFFNVISFNYEIPTVLSDFYHPHFHLVLEVDSYLSLDYIESFIASSWKRFSGFSVVGVQFLEGEKDE